MIERDRTSRLKPMLNAGNFAAAIQHTGKRQRALKGLAEIERGDKGSFYKIHNDEPR